MAYVSLKRICIGVIAVAAVASALAADEPLRTAIVFEATSHEIRGYDVTVKVSGRMPVHEDRRFIDLDVVYDLSIQHRYGRRGVDGLLPLDISVKRAAVTADGQKLTMLPDSFPKITVLLDESWRIKEVFGLDDYPRTVPGINYGNLVVLFFPGGLAEPRQVGETWKTAAGFPPFGEKYSFFNTLASVDNKDGVATCTVRQEITWLPGEADAATTRAVAESVFSVPGGRLLKSNAQCDIEFKNLPSAQQGQSPVRANIAIEVAPAKQQ